MTEKRVQERHRKRIQLRYGVDDATTMGFTDDISEEGLFIRAAMIESEGSLITVELFTPDNEKVVLEGTVQWSIRVPPTMLRHGKKGGMGIKISRFISGEESYRELCKVLSGEN
jgi:hypothetical protein